MSAATLMRVVDSPSDSLSAFLEPGWRLFAVMDTCDEPRILKRIHQLEAKAACLYSGKAAENFYAIAPYVCSADEELLTWITHELKDAAWGFFAVATADCDLETLRRHLRKFLLVSGPDGRELYFRFYDPRVLVTVLENVSPEEAKEFFGPIVHIGVIIDPSVQIRLFSLP